jgi:hypothetical protein
MLPSPAKVFSRSDPNYWVSHIIVTRIRRPEGLTVNRPDRQAGKRVVYELSAEGAAQQRGCAQRPPLIRNAKVIPASDGRAY